MLFFVNTKSNNDKKSDLYLDYLALCIHAKEICVGVVAMCHLQVIFVLDDKRMLGFELVAWREGADLSTMIEWWRINLPMRTDRDGQDVVASEAISTHNPPACPHACM